MFEAIPVAGAGSLAPAVPGHRPSLGTGCVPVPRRGGRIGVAAGDYRHRHRSEPESRRDGGDGPVSLACGPVWVLTCQRGPHGTAEVLGVFDRPAGARREINDEIRAEKESTPLIRPAARMVDIGVMEITAGAVTLRLAKHQVQPSRTPRPQPPRAPAGAAPAGSPR